jgi:hypothetical protein
MARWVLKTLETVVNANEVISEMWRFREMMVIDLKVFFFCFVLFEYIFNYIEHKLLFGDYEKGKGMRCLLPCSGGCFGWRYNLLKNT